MNIPEVLLKYKRQIIVNCVYTLVMIILLIASIEPYIPKFVLFVGVVTVSILLEIFNYGTVRKQITWDGIKPSWSYSRSIDDLDFYNQEQAKVVVPGASFLAFLVAILNFGSELPGLSRKLSLSVILSILVILYFSITDKKSIFKIEFQRSVFRYSLISSVYISYVYIFGSSYLLFYFVCLLFIVNYFYKYRINNRYIQEQKVYSVAIETDCKFKKGIVVASTDKQARHRILENLPGAKEVSIIENLGSMEDYFRKRENNELQNKFYQINDIR